MCHAWVDATVHCNTWWRRSQYLGGQLYLGLQHTRQSTSDVALGLMLVSCDRRGHRLNFRNKCVWTEDYGKQYVHMEE